MDILKNNKISHNIHGVPGTRFLSMIQCNYVMLCHCTSIYAKKYVFGERGETNKRQKNYVFGGWGGYRKCSKNCRKIELYVLNETYTKSILVFKS